ncbi:MAG: hypothetical protein IJS14_07825 [Lentisphaeria bacterium]|nr:hypothetical protein [Lentisphaeria bacterium]
MKKTEKIIGWIFFALYAALTLTAVFCHEPWRDELHTWIMARELSAFELIYWMRYDGHFALWHLTLHPFAAAGFPLATLNLVAWALCIVGTGLFFFRTRLPLWVRCLLLFSCPLFFYYPVVARPYCLVPLALYFLTELYPVRLRHPFRYAFAILFVLYIHSYLAGLAGMLGLFFLIDLIRHYRRFPDPLRLKRIALPPALMLLGALAAFLMVIPAVGESTVVPKTFGEFFGQDLPRGILRALSALPANCHALQVSDWVPAPAIAVIYWACILSGLALLWKTCRQMVWIWLGSLLWMLTMSAMVFPMLMHRGYLPFLFLVFALGLTPPRKVRKDPPKRLQAAGWAAAAVLTVLTYPFAWEMFHLDLRHPFSNQGQMAAFIEQNVPKGTPIVTFPSDLNCATFTAYLPEHHFHDCGTAKRYRVYQKQGRYPRELNDAVLYYYSQGSKQPFYLLFFAQVVNYYGLTPEKLARDFRHFKVEFVYATDPPAFFPGHEDYCLFKVTPR